MKNIFLLLAIVSTAYATAQSKAITPQQASVKDLAAMKVKEMDKMLNLTDSQEKKLLALFSDKDIIAKIPKSAQELQSKRAKIDTKLKAILSPEQFEKLTSNGKVLNSKERTAKPQ